MIKAIAKSFKKKYHQEAIDKTPAYTALVFKNQFYEELDCNYNNFFIHECQRVNTEQPLIQQIRRISFELSNICNYSVFHKKCPASRVKEKKILPAKIVYKAISEMAEMNYNGVFVFHRYNEPLIDPRLFHFISYAKKECPDSNILILTNGFYLTQELAQELAELDIWILAVSAYSMSEYKRLIQLDIPIPYYVFYATLDDRQDIYRTKPINLQLPCDAPLRDLTINAYGDIALCCLDWKNKYIFGNLREETIHNIIHKESFQKTHDDLIQGKRQLNICERCAMSR